MMKFNALFYFVFSLFYLLFSSCFFKPEQSKKTTAISNSEFYSPESASIPIFTQTEVSKTLNVKQKKSWADSVFETLSPDERIAQLFMVAAWSNKNQQHVNEISDLITKYKIGGVIWMQGGPTRQAALCNYYQSLSKVPLFNSIDGEWGLAMRLDSTVKFPRQMTLGALKDEQLIYEMGCEIARECKRIGLQINFAPVADVNNNPDNPVIGSRSFGENKFNVAKKALAYMRGLQDNGVMANAKHFPGHGDTDADSHLTLPVINHSKERIDSLELYPFRELIKNGLGSTMVAHLYIPALDSTPNKASTLSSNVINNLLKRELGFKGLVFTDALNMKGVAKFFSPGEVDWRALIAGNDVLLFAEDVPTAIEKIKDRICDSLILHEEIDRRCLKILKAKEWAGLNNYQPVKLENLYEDLNNKKAELINRKLIENSITLLSNKNNLIPLKSLDTLKIATVSINHDNKDMFQNRIDSYAKVDHFYLSSTSSKSVQDSLITKLNAYNLIIIGTFNLNNKPENNFGITPQLVGFIDSICKIKTTIIDVFNNAFTLRKLKGLENAAAVVMSYNDNELTHDLSAQLIFGGITSRGRLPVTASDLFKIGAGIDSEEPIRLKYSIPEELGVANQKFAAVDTFINNAIKMRATPGCQITAIKDGMVFYQKSFGYHTYDSLQRVTNYDLYDLASLTKIVGALPAVIKITDEKKIQLDDELGKHLTLTSEKKAKLTLREILAHQSGLPAWIPFWKSTIKNNILDSNLYSSNTDSIHTLKVADQLYIKKSIIDSIYQKIEDCKLDETKKYVYSDLGFYYLNKLAENKSGLTLDNYMKKYFYESIGISRITYKPLEKFSSNQIIPTENDTVWRKQLLRGDVHDQGAALMGGVGGHAGLFASANDVGVMMQLYLNGGAYGGNEYFSKATFSEFNKIQYPENQNRRGAGFDKPDKKNTKDGPSCKSASLNSFGHSGFTGTYAWADPENKLVFIFLSNRVYPDAENKKLLKNNIRTNIQQVFYDAFEN